jgi:hypothetical protein
VLIAARLAEGRHVGSGEGWGDADDRVKATNLARLATDRHPARRSSTHRNGRRDTQAGGEVLARH